MNTSAADDAAPRVVTVTGPVAPDELGVVLPHEHLLVDFIGAGEVSPDRYDSEEVFRAVLPHLERARDLGCGTLVECTPDYLGRDAALMARLSKASGVRILTNTGYYGAMDDRFVPDHAHAETAGQLAERWIAEWENGIGETGIRPGFIKIGLDPGPLSMIDRKLVEAAGHAHLRTGLTIAAHSGNAAAALEALAILEDLDVAGSALVWVHAHLESDPEVHARAAAKGVWLEFDGLSPGSLDAHLRAAMAMKERGYWKRVLVSHDAGWYSVGEPEGGAFRMFDTLFTHFIPAAEAAGCTERDIRQLVRENPARAFTVARRTLG